MNIRLILFLLSSMLLVSCRTIKPITTVVEKQPIIMEDQFITEWLSSNTIAVYFDTNSYFISNDESIKIIQSLDKETKSFYIIGYCDERGTNEYNYELGLKRANAVKEYLESIGYFDCKFELLSYGKNYSNHGCSFWNEDRKVVILCVK